MSLRIPLLRLGNNLSTSHLRGAALPFLVVARRAVMKTLISKDRFLLEALDKESAHMHLLSSEELQCVHGGRAVSAMVDGRPGYTVDDFEINMAIFEGRIGGSYLL
jgi:hypothetical protein